MTRSSYSSTEVEKYFSVKIQSSSPFHSNYKIRKVKDTKSYTYQYHRKKKKIWKWYVYILECLDDSYYTGMTWDPSIRFEQHLTGYGGKYSSEHGVKKLVYLEEHEDFELARERENK